MRSRRMKLLQSWMLLSVTVLTLTLWPKLSHSQDEPEKVCLTGSEINATIDAGCQVARAAETRLDSVTDDLDACQTQRDDKNGELRGCESSRAILASQLASARGPILPSWLFATWDVIALGLGAATGFCAGRCGESATVGLAVGFSILGLGRVVFEFLR